MVQKGTAAAPDNDAGGALCWKTVGGVYRRSFRRRPEDPHVGSCGSTERNSIRRQRSGHQPRNLRVFGDSDRLSIVALLHAARALLQARSRRRRHERCPIPGPCRLNSSAATTSAADQQQTTVASATTSTNLARKRTAARSLTDLRTNSTASQHIRIPVSDTCNTVHVPATPQPSAHSGRRHESHYALPSVAEDLWWMGPRAPAPGDGD